MTETTKNSRSLKDAKLSTLDVIHTVLQHVIVVKRVYRGSLIIENADTVLTRKQISQL